MSKTMEKLVVEQTLSILLYFRLQNMKTGQFFHLFSKLRENAFLNDIVDEQLLEYDD